MSIIQNNLLTVYHGTISQFDIIDVSQGKPYKDFGRGFYVTESELHATNLALRNKYIEKARYGRDCDAYLYTYEIDRFKLIDFKVKEFQKADNEWLEFIISNRKVRNRTHNYDIVTGPTANDDTMVVINAYLDALYGNIGEDAALKTLLRNIKADKLPAQIYFSNNKATGALTQKGQVKIL